MRISLDVDDTLVCRPSDAPIERRRFPAFILGSLIEPLRLGTRELVQELRRRGCEVWIYTSSSRSPLYIRMWLFLYGVRVDGIVNDGIHRRELRGRKFSRRPSKYPPAFGIQLHIDDSEGVKVEGDEHGFRVLLINPTDKRWTRRVLAAVEQTAVQSVLRQNPSLSAPDSRIEQICNPTADASESQQISGRQVIVPGQPAVQARRVEAGKA